jgi:intracellular sulfur oxidation DsrE/DsrF family protein
MENNFSNGNAPRREFLGTLATGAALLGMSVLPKPVKANGIENLFDNSPADVDAWLNKITGKHKIVFDATDENHGFPFAWANVYLLTNNNTGTQDKDLSVVVILRHEAIPLAMKDEAWVKYKLGENFKINDKKTNAPSERNTYYNVADGELPLPDMAIDKLQKRGVLFGVCDMALTFYSHMLAPKYNMQPDDVKKEWVAALLPDIQTLPSGVWAVNRAQEKGCSYCFAG